MQLNFLKKIVLLMYLTYEFHTLTLKPQQKTKEMQESMKLLDVEMKRSDELARPCASCVHAAYPTYFWFE